MKWTIQYSSMEIQSPAKQISSEQPRAFMSIACHFLLPITISMWIQYLQLKQCERTPDSLKYKNPPLFCFQKLAFFFSVQCHTGFLQLHQTSFTTSQLSQDQIQVQIQPKGISCSLPQVCILILHNSFAFIFLN